MAWYSKLAGNEKDVVLSTRIRLARNIDNIKFPSIMGENDYEIVINKLKKVFDEESEYQMAKLEDMDDITKIALVENHIVSPDFITKPAGRAIIIDKDETISIMVNEEDHLRIQSIVPGQDLEYALKLATNIDKKIQKNIEIAQNDTFGFLTACPTNAGTGLRASLMMHLPGLVMKKYIFSLLNSANKFGIAIRGLYGEGTESIGNLFQVSNQVTMGFSEEEIINNLKSISNTIIEQERNARTLLLKNRIPLEDLVYRSYGILINARVISSNEFIKLWSDVRLGVELEIIKETNLETLNKLLIITKPANLQKNYHKVLEPQDRDIVRAEIVRRELK